MVFAYEHIISDEYVFADEEKDLRVPRKVLSRCIV